MELNATDEGRHLPGTDQFWGESWYHDFAAADGSYGGYLRLGLYPNQKVAWSWIYLVRAGRPLVVVRDHTVPCPEFVSKSDDSQVLVRSLVKSQVNSRADSAHAGSSTWEPVQPLQSYRILASGNGIELANPADAFLSVNDEPETGPPVAVELDLTWTGVTPPYAYTMTTRFEQSAWVDGTIRIGDDSLTVHCPGQRDHSWGTRDWWLFGWVWCSGRLDDGTWWHSVRSIVPKLDIFQTGYIVTPDMTLTPVSEVGIEYALDADQLPRHGTLTVGDLVLDWEAQLSAPVLLVSPEGKQSRLPRALCRFTTADGRTGTGWIEFNFPDGVARSGQLEGN